MSRPLSTQDAGIREIRDLDVPSVVSFHNANYLDTKTPEQWFWKYKGRYPDLLVFVVLEDRGRIVGTQGMIPIYLRIGGQDHLSGKSEDSLLDPAYRGGSAFQELYRFAMSMCAARNMCCVWGLTSASKVWRDKLGFAVYKNALHNSVMVLNMPGMVRDVLKTRGVLAKRYALCFWAILGYAYSWTCRHIHGIPNFIVNGAFSVQGRLRCPDDMDSLYERLTLRHPGLIWIRQDEDYIKWRILNNPSVKYRTYFLYGRGLLRGYCYLASNAGSDIAYLTDLTFEDPKSGLLLLHRAVDALRSQNVSSVVYFGNVENAAIREVFRVLKRFGFLERRSSAAFVVKNISCEHGQSLYEIENWYLNGLWTEGYTF